MTKIYLDTNVILDFIDINRAGNLLAKKLIDYLYSNDFEIFMSEDMVSTFYYISKDKKVVLEFFKLVINEWHIVPFGKDVIETALDITLDNACDLEDVMQCLCAKANGCDALIANDKDFYSCGIACLSADDFMQRVV